MWHNVRRVLKTKKPTVTEEQVPMSTIEEAAKQAKMPVLKGTKKAPVQAKGGLKPVSAKEPKPAAPAKTKSQGVRFKTKAEYASEKGEAKPASAPAPAPVKPKSTGARFKTKAEYEAMKNGNKPEEKVKPSSPSTDSGDEHDPNYPSSHYDKTGPGSYQHKSLRSSKSTGTVRAVHAVKPDDEGKMSIRPNHTSSSASEIKPDHSDREMHNKVFNKRADWGRKNGIKVRMGTPLEKREPKVNAPVQSFKSHAANDNFSGNAIKDFGKYRPTMKDRF